jgi:formylglycine-generating enzyme required for sulfatase activity
MVCCLNPDCPKPVNQDSSQYCLSCGTKLIPLLRHRFKIIQVLGHGGFGKTYLAEDADRLHAPCVVKQLAYQGQGTQAALAKVRNLFAQEAQQLFQLESHPQIPDLLAYFEEQGYLYLVQEFIPGQTLLQELQTQGSFSAAKIRQTLEGLLPVLAFIHGQGVIHRDLKPENLMRRQANGQLVLIDFGVAKQTTLTQLTLTGTTLGSQGYAPLEQMEEGKAKPASDLFSLAACCFHLWSGVNPRGLLLRWGYSWVNHWQQHLPEPIDSQLAQVLDRMLQVDLDQRYATAAAVLQDLHTVTVPLPPSPAPSPVPIAPTVYVLPTQRFEFKTATLVLLEKRGLFRKAVWETQYSRQTAQFFAEDLGNSVSLEMIAIPGGTFTMGSPTNEPERTSDESPQHSVTVPAFYLGKYPITQAQWQAIMGSNPSRFQGANRPVESIFWNEAIEFCQKLSQATDRAYRLPSEAEWEYGCRAGTTTPFYFGETITTDLANYNGEYTYGSAPKGQYRKQTTKVGSFPPNAFGLYDLHGNVWEWCQDTWHENYKGAPTNGSAWVSENDNDYRVLRGGSWSGNHRGSAVLRTATGLLPASATSTSVFGWPCLRQGLLNPLLSCSFALCPLFFTLLFPRAVARSNFFFKV